MPRVNLLPWRAEQRTQRKKEFLGALGIAVAVGAAIILGVKFTYNSWIDNQQARNSLLKQEITLLDKQIQEILGLENQKERLLARMEIIEQLQRSRPESVHLFDELVQTLPEGVYLTDVSQNGRRVQIKGAAQSSTRVSALMRNIDSSDWLKDPGLDVVETVNDGPARNAAFTVFAQQIAMDEEDEAFAEGLQ
jgi:type IV pilus assembly protein PilN